MAESLLECEKRWHVYLDEVAGGNGEALASLYDEAGALLYCLARSGAWRWLAVLARSRAIDRLRGSAAKRKLEELGHSPAVISAARVYGWTRRACCGSSNCASLNELPREQRSA